MLTPSLNLIQQDVIQDAVQKILEGMGLWQKAESGMQDTPARVAKFLMEYCRPFNPEEILSPHFDNPCKHSEMIVQQNIPFRMLCEHHLLPATGKAAIGYVAGDRLVGLSKLYRLVDAAGTERPSLQEVITDKIATALEDHLQARGVIVVIKAEHGCMACRGVNRQGILTSTSSIRGVFRDVPAAKQEFFNILNLGS